jgi:hypothetical protein
MIGRHFVSNDELVELLTKDHDADEQEIRAMVHSFSHRMRRGRSFVGRCPTNSLLQSNRPKAVASLEAVDAARRAT